MRTDGTREIRRRHGKNFMGSAFVCGTPVIVYDCTALPEVVNDQCGFVVKEHDLKSVIDCIKKASNIFEQSKIVDAATKYSKQQITFV